MNTGDDIMDVRSHLQLEGVDLTLVNLLTAFAADKRCPFSFIVTDGHRTTEEQYKLVAAGASWTMKSKHLTGRAVDLCVVISGKARWELPLYDKLIWALKEVAKERGVKIVCGIDWKKKDACHVELAPDIA